MCEFEHVYYWSDNTSVLACINNKTKKFAVYTANRIAIILSLSNPSMWFWVPSSLNPADVGSRGVSPANFNSDMKFWLDGPEFLYSEPANISEDHDVPIIDDSCIDVFLTIDNVIETKPLRIVDSVYLTRLIEYHSDLNKLLKTTVRLMRRLNKDDVSKEPINVFEFDAAELMLLKYEQRLIIVKNLRRYSPFHDDKGLLRIGGRIGAAQNLDYNVRHPYVLPRKSHY